MCERWERRLLSDSARQAGRPAPSGSVINLPSLGSADAKATGFACIGGQAFQKIPNGWPQVMAPAGLAAMRRAVTQNASKAACI